MFSNSPEDKVATLEKKFRDQLEAVAVPNERVIENRCPDTGETSLGVPLNYPWYMSPLVSLFNPDKIKSYRLDNIGLEIYRELDGKKSVENLIDGLMEKHMLTFFEARGLILHYLATLMKSGIIAIAMPEPVESSS